MAVTSFEALKDQFKQGDVDTKIELYLSSEGLSQPQYKELLRMFPLEDLHKLEQALDQAYTA